MSESDAAPMPRLGEVFFDVRGDSRSMRLSWYSDTGVAVFSVWQGGTCTGTFRLPIDDLPRMVDTLRRGPAGDPLAGREAGAAGEAAPDDPQAPGPATAAMRAVPYGDAAYDRDMPYGGAWPGYPDAGPPGYGDDPLGLGPARSTPSGSSAPYPGEGASAYPDEGGSAYPDRPGRGRHRHAGRAAYPGEPRERRADPPGYAAGVPARGSHHADASPALSGYERPGYQGPGYERPQEERHGYGDEWPALPDAGRGPGFGDDPLGQAYAGDSLPGAYPGRAWRHGYPGDEREEPFSYGAPGENPEEREHRARRRRS